MLNARRIAETKIVADRDAWLEDARHFEQALSSISAKKLDIPAAQPAGELRELVEKWRKQALAMVPPEYAERQMHGKYFRLDNEAAGIDACADELEDVLQKVKPASTEDTYNEGGGVA
jgi:hypothetical protein